jgi:hypothetical protein
VTGVGTLHAGVLTALRRITTITVYDNVVPDHPPATADGRVYPYVVLWADPGIRPAASRELESATSGDLTWQAVLTVASGDVMWTLDTVSLVRSALDGTVLTPWAAPLEEDPTITNLPVLKDRGVNPARHYVQLTYLTTTG